MFPTSILPRSSFVFLALAFSFFASAKRLDILVSAKAEEDYVERSEQLEYQTYHFLKGTFFSGSIRDKGLESAEFESLAESLVDPLKKRKMYPEIDRGKGDLLIMLSWGRTSLAPDLQELQGILSSDDMAGSASLDAASSGGDLVAAGGGQNALMVSASSSSPSSSVGDGQTLGSFGGNQTANNRALLGLDGPLAAPSPFGVSPDEKQWNALEEERYFVILNAFDYQHLLQKKELKQVWQVRYNTRAVGVGFQTAFESMNDAVAGVIGLNLEKVASVKGDTGGKVSLGDLEVVKMSEDDRRVVKKR